MTSTGTYETRVSDLVPGEIVGPSGGAWYVVLAAPVHESDYITVHLLWPDGGSSNREWVDPSHRLPVCGFVPGSPADPDGTSDPTWDADWGALLFAMGQV